MAETGLCSLEREIRPDPDWAVVMDTQEQHRKNVEMLQNHASSTQWKTSTEQPACLWGVTLWKVLGQQEGRQTNR